jgi:predicted secreted protein
LLTGLRKRLSSVVHFAGKERHAMRHDAFQLVYSFRAVGSWLIALAAAGCAATMPTTGQLKQQERVLGMNDNGATIEVTPGEEFEVRLYADPGQGLFWSVEPTNYAPVQLLQGSPTTVPGAGIPGNRELQVFRFRSTSGEGTLILRKATPWETNQPPRAQFSVNVRTLRSRT